MSGFSIINKIRNKIKIQPQNKLNIHPSTRIRYCNIYIAGKDNLLVIAKGANLKRVSIELIGNNCTLIIGEGCVIGEHCYLSCRENSTKLTIGKSTMFSRNVKIMTSDGHDILENSKRINYAKDINIGNHVWLADNTTILKGVTIGDNSIIGINSTVTKSVPINSIAAGNPAKVVKSSIYWEETLTY
ncbi:acyltransferase [Vibrio sp. S4M6]|uniref:acyltransferase n=1 Tax=Vibrio sinus TaxID=2946865 RepID=UPI00202ABE1F|nr:acyltransferase [Vibrio sinus]MCL9780367.1 acyltransferase [Vibrio sinus]